MTLLSLLTGESRVPCDRVDYYRATREYRYETLRKERESKYDREYLSEYDELKRQYIYGYISLSMFSSKVSRLKKEYGYPE